MAAYEHIIRLRDQMSAKLRSIAGAASESIGKLTTLASKAKTLQGAAQKTGGSIASLREKIDTLRQEKELLSPDSLKQIKQYNRDIYALERQVEKLDNAGKGGKLKNYLSGLAGALKPLIAGAAIFGAVGFLGKTAMNFDEGMAKVNITAQLDEKGLSGLKDKLKTIAKDNKADIAITPVGFEKIISQTGDVDMSLDILNASLKGSKAGFTDLDTVTGALAQTLSIVGKGNASAQEVLDTFFAAKRVGAGEFKDFATYMPGLIAGADALGVNYKSVAGIFAYMTGKGQDAARASVLMSNMFSMLGKTDITKNLDKAGVKVFDMQGKMRGVVDIFKDLGAVMAGMSDQQKTAFLEKIGIVDKEAKAAFAIMGSDIGKLTVAMNDTANSSGETAAALEFSKNTVQKTTEVWNQFKNELFDLGQTLLPVISVGLEVLSLAISGVSSIIRGVIGFFSGWADALRDGNPLVWGLTVALGALTLGLIAFEMWTNRAVIATKVKSLWDGIAGIATSGWTTAQWVLNSAMYACPIVWIIALIAGLIAAIVACCTKVQGWGKQWQVITDFMKNLWDLFCETFKFRWNLLTNGFMMGLDKIRLGWYKFKESVGLGDSSENQAMIAEINTDVEDRKQAIIDGAKKVRDLASKTANSMSWELSWKKDEKEKPGTEAPAAAAIPALPGQAATNGKTPDFTTLMQGLGNKTGKGNKIDLDQITPDYKGTTAYSAIAARFAQVKMQPAANATKIVQAPAPNPASVSAIQPGKVAAEIQALPQDNTDYAGEKTDWLKIIADRLEKMTATTGPVLANLQRIAASAAAILAVSSAISGGPVLPEPPLMAQTPGVEITAQPVPVLVQTPGVEVINKPAPALLQPAPTVKIANTVPAMLPQPALAEAPAIAPAPERPAINNQYNEQNAYETRNTRSVHFEKYCENVVINIQNTDQRGRDEIEKVIQETLTSIMDNYEA